MNSNIKPANKIHSPENGKKDFSHKKHVLCNSILCSYPISFYFMWKPGYFVNLALDWAETTRPPKQFILYFHIKGGQAEVLLPPVVWLRHHVASNKIFSVLLLFLLCFFREYNLHFLYMFNVVYIHFYSFSINNFFHSLLF